MGRRTDTARHIVPPALHIRILLRPLHLHLRLRQRQMLQMLSPERCGRSELGGIQSRTNTARIESTR